MNLAKVLFLLLVFSSLLFAQSLRNRNSLIFFELGGNGGLISINYEHFVSNKNALRIGFSNVGILSDRITALPIIINHLFLQGEEKIEIGAGILLTFNENDNHKYKIGNVELGNITPTTFVGLRSESNNGVVFRLGLVTFIKNTIAFSYGLSLGYSF